MLKDVFNAVEIQQPGEAKPTIHVVVVLILGAYSVFTGKENVRRIDETNVADLKLYIVSWLSIYRTINISLSLLNLNCHKQSPLTTLSIFMD